MSKIAYVNGRYKRHDSAFINIEDRGFQFADGVYEVVAVHNKKLVDLEQHLDRLERSLFELRLNNPKSRISLKLIIDQIIRRNRISSGSIYIQITRGSAPRDFSYSNNLIPSVIICGRKSPPFTIRSIQKKHEVISQPDLRWGRCDIKSVSLLAATMAKQCALEVGADETWMFDQNGFVTEGTSSNAWIVSGNKQLITKGTDTSILPGITRQRIINLAKYCKIDVIERPFSIQEVLASSEAFCSSSTFPIKPVVKFDSHKVGDGKIGPITKLLIKNYLKYLGNIGDK